jgi:flagellar biosynthesis/type III secretory pathway M-ring protein FliF/YscJ
VRYYISRILDRGKHMNDIIIYFLLFIAVMVIIYFIVREFRIMQTSNRQMELELEREKLERIQKEISMKVAPFTKLSAEQVGGLRVVEEDINKLDTDIYAKEKEVEARLKRLENRVQKGKLDKMLNKISVEERKMG